MSGEIFIAKDGACISTPGGEFFIVQGKTTIRAGHPLHLSHPHLWEPMKVDFEIEPAPPGEDEDDEEPERAKTAAEAPPIKSASPRTQGARTRA